MLFCISKTQTKGQISLFWLVGSWIYSSLLQFEVTLLQSMLG